MARKLENKTNVQAPASDYPFGRIKDNPGDNSGTPVNEEVYGDFHQFFEKLMHDAGISFNDLPENNTDGFQFIEALAAYIRQTSATDTRRGTVERATQAEVNAATDALRYITPALIAGATAIISEAALKNGVVTTAKLAEGATATSKIANNAVTLGKMAANSVDSDQYVDGSVDDRHLAQARVKVAPGTPQLVSKVLEIGDWSFGANYPTPFSIKLLPHGLGGDWRKIRQIAVIMRNDTDDKYIILPKTENLNFADLYVHFDHRNIVLTIYLGSKDADWDSTDYNRGWVTITYEE